MDFTPSDEHRMIYDYGRNLATRYDRPYWRDKTASKTFPDEMWRQIGTDGFLGMLVPEAYGGTGLGVTEMALLIEGIAAEGLPLFLMLTGPAIAMPVIAGFGSEAQKQDILPGFCTGEAKVCFAIAEANVGANVARLKTRATQDGTGWRLNGEKNFTSGADVCDYVLVLARSLPPEEAMQKNHGFTLFLIEREKITMSPQDVGVPMPLQQCNLSFDDLELGPEHVVGEPHMAMMALFSTMNVERITAAAMSCGMGRYLVRKGAAYASERTVFEGPIGAYQAVQHPLAEAHTQVEMAHLVMLQAATQHDAGTPADEAANMAKYASAEASMLAAEAALQVHGGNGYAPEYDIYDIYQVCRLLRSAPVSRERALCFIAERSLGLPRSY